MSECRCECGYRCGGPGACKLSISECLSRGDGQHFVKDCDHDFQSGEPVEDDRSWSIACKCGLTAMPHDMRHGP